MATISITWRRPISLVSGRSDNLIYTCDTDAIPDDAGVYVFGRAHGESFEAIYIGETENLRKRISQHLKSVPLMMALENARTGSRQLHVGRLEGKPGQSEKSALKRVERAMIKYALAQGHELVNEMGTKTPYDKILFSGNLECRRVFGQSMHVEK